MNEFAELEISLRRWQDDSYEVETIFSQPGSESRAGSDPSLLKFDAVKLLEFLPDQPEYGRYLSETLFSSGELRKSFSKAEAIAQSKQIPLRLRINIRPNARELHDFHWETLRHPENDSLLATNRNTLFSRFLNTSDYRAVRTLPKEGLRALVVIANPKDLSSYVVSKQPLAPIDVDGELKRARAGLGDMEVKTLAASGEATLNNLIEQLNQGCEILYLVCHGAMIQGTHRIWLEDEQGNSITVPGIELAMRISEMREPPRLVVLASCQSAGSGDDAAAGDKGALSALGPLLVETAGVSAAIGMQGNVSMKTVEQIMPVFFRELRKDGLIDMALAVARGNVRERHDSWMPVLFMRLDNGCLWSDRATQSIIPTFDRWEALLSNIEQGRCTPIIGYGLVETLLGPSREIAKHWSESFRFPFESGASDDLPQVAQYLAVNQQPVYPKEELRKYLIRQMKRRYKSELQSLADRDSNDQNLFDDMLKTIGELRRKTSENDPHRVLAQLPCPIYITTNPDGLLPEALKAEGKDPQIEMCRWNDDLETLDSVFDKTPDYRPDKRKPLVYHLFGQLADIESLVLTEDDYFDYLIGVTGNNDLVPAVIRRSLTDTALLFIGFQLDGWNFRVLFRSLMNRQGGSRRKKYTHVAVQIDPKHSSTSDPDQARKYLERYFQTADISIFWGSAQEFINELHQRWKAHLAEEK